MPLNHDESRAAPTVEVRAACGSLGLAIGHAEAALDDLSGSEGGHHLTAVLAEIRRGTVLLREARLRLAAVADRGLAPSGPGDADA